MRSLPSFSASRLAAAAVLALALIGCQRTTALASPGSAILVAGDGQARLINAQTLAQIGQWTLSGAVIGAWAHAGHFYLVQATGDSGLFWTADLAAPRATRQRALPFRPTAWTMHGTSALIAGVATNGQAGVYTLGDTGSLHVLVAPYAAPQSLAVDAGQHLLIGVGNSVAVYSLPRGDAHAHREALVHLPSPARQIVTLPYGHKAFVLCGDQVAALDSARGMLLTYLRPGGQPQRLQLKPDGGELYVSNADGAITVIDTTRNEVAETMAAGAGAGAMAVAPDGSVLYVGNAAAGTVSVVDLSTRRNLALIRVGQDPAQLLLTAGGTIYAADAGSDDLAVLRGNQDAANPNTLVTLLPSPPHPHWLLEGRLVEGRP